jgi:hypothetical protein
LNPLRREADMFRVLVGVVIVAVAIAIIVMIIRAL